ncbi:hypothetical protein QJS04_geneDACA019993 [Acorus gramineus]|uniref:Uncharacterized protein n=1 Tax=Acorus gramineus TaxID=55184 RepID=A0AAV9B6W2_ACOGR|nr:hypothetical protein QJS04_geneDACA019993 [Acorus gramineus]
MDRFEKVQALPEKGRLMQAILLVAGPLPMWRNPPLPLKRLQIPLVGLERRVLDRWSAKRVKA